MHLYMGIIILFVFVFHKAICLDILQLVGPRLSSVARKFDTRNYSLSEAEELITRYGYPVETHEVVSDKYVLKLHRIPYDKKYKTKKKRPVALFHHGLFGASDCFLFRGPELDLPYVLADAGYDVWLVNIRGNYYSRSHMVLNPDTDRNFWEFSMHECAVGDLPKIIDYILEKTRERSLFFIGYSLGCNIGYILCSERPKYNAKIKLFISLAPFVPLAKQNPALDLISEIFPIFAETLNFENITEVLPSRQITGNLIRIFCQNQSPSQYLCLKAMFYFTGEDYLQLNTVRYNLLIESPQLGDRWAGVPKIADSDPTEIIFPEIATYFPAGTSLHTLLHLTQMIKTGRFRPLVYEPEINRVKYGHDFPQDYDLTRITTSSAIFYGDGDKLATTRDCEALVRKLFNVVGLYKVASPSFNHLDFMWGSNAKHVVYDPIVHLMNKYR